MHGFSLMCVVKVSASDLNSGNGYVVCGRERAFGGSGFVVFVCYFAYFLRCGILPTGPA